MSRYACGTNARPPYLASMWPNPVNTRTGWARSTSPSGNAEREFTTWRAVVVLHTSRSRPTATFSTRSTQSTRSFSSACLRLQPASCQPGWGAASPRVPSHPCRSSPRASRAPTRRLNDVDRGPPARAPWPAAAPPWPYLAWRSSAPLARTCAPPRALTRGRTPTTRHSRASFAARMQRVNP